MPMKGDHTDKRATASRAKADSGQEDAIDLLMADHREVEKLFGQFEKGADGRKDQLAQKICLALKVHTQVEEELFYPAARDALSDREEPMLDEAVVEHASAKQLIGEIEAMDAGDDLFDARVKVLSEMIEHHVGEEEKEMFPKVRKTDLDLTALGARMKARKDELMSRMGSASAKPS